MAKVLIKSEKLTPFGGIFSIMEKFDSMLSPVIDSTLGQRCRSINIYKFVFYSLQICFVTDLRLCLICCSPSLLCRHAAFVQQPCRMRLQRYDNF